MKNNLYSLNIDNSKNIAGTKRSGSIVYYNFSNSKNKKFDTQQVMYKLGEIAVQGFFKITDKNKIGQYTLELQNCFDLGCYILYGRDISDEILQKQKAYGDEYLADFLKYILRMFFKSYDQNYILTKEQCCDIRSLLAVLLSTGEYNQDHIRSINFLSGKEITEYLRSLLAGMLI